MNAIAKLSALMVAAAVCVAMPAHAQTNTSTNAPAGARTRNPRYSGVIASVDATNMVVTLKATTRRPESKIKVTSATKIKKEGEPAEFSAAVAGMYVTGSAKKDGEGVLTATTMNISAKAPARAKKAPATTPPAAGQ
ncbi:MAG TPA: hypothetical protein VGO59_05860 [Verrucomicrobiae bacterium]|jgi:hypothetical protein